MFVFMKEYTTETVKIRKLLGEQFSLLRLLVVERIRMKSLKAFLSFMCLRGGQAEVRSP